MDITGMSAMTNYNSKHNLFRLDAENIDAVTFSIVEAEIRRELKALSDKSSLAVNPFYGEVDIEILVYRYLKDFEEGVDKIINASNISIRKEEAHEMSLQKVIKDIRGLDNAITGTLDLKNCKWCGELFRDSDEFCSPQCLENYANNYLKQQDLPK